MLTAKAYGERSVFEPENLLREGRRQRGRPEVAVPPVCLLDPDGDIVRHLVGRGEAVEHPGWACYHTTLWVFELAGVEVGVVGCAVGASFAVLIAEQLAVSGCELVVSVTSSGSITPVAEPPHFVLIDRALRDEGTSLHYLPSSTWAIAPPALFAAVADRLGAGRPVVVVGSTWTTDAPYRETPSAISRAKDLGVVAVEMEAAALYAYASARGRDIICLAHVTNTMAVGGDDFEKGDAAGAPHALEILAVIVELHSRRQPR